MELVIPKKFTPLFDPNEERRRFISCTGRNSGKTVGYTYKAVDTLVNKHLDVWVLRAVNAKIGNSIYRTLKNTIIEMGIGAEFKFYDSAPFKILHKPSGACMDFSGLDVDPLSIKGYENRQGKGKLGMIWFEEFTELSDPDNMNVAIKTGIRYMNSKGVICWSGNPSKFNAHWSWNWVESKRKLKSYCMIDINFRDIWDLLSEFNKEEIRLDYQSDKRLFDFTYDGKRLTLEGLVYSMLEEDRWLKNIADYDFHNEIPVELGIGVDVATENDKTCAVPILMTSKGRGIVLKMYCYNPKLGVKKTITDQCYDIIRWFQGLYAEYDFIKGIPVKWAFDPSNMGMKMELTRYMSLDSKEIQKDVLKDIMKVQSLITTNRLYFLDLEENQVLKDEFEHLTWKTKKSTKELALEEHGLAPQKYVLGEDDAENALRYIAQTLFKNHTSLYVIDKLHKKSDIF